MPTCAVPMCATSGGNRFPRDEKMKKAWIIAIKRDKFEPKTHSVVCQKHFKPEDYVSESHVYGKCITSC